MSRNSNRDNVVREARQYARQTLQGAHRLPTSSLKTRREARGAHAPSTAEVLSTSPGGIAYQTAAKRLRQYGRTQVIRKGSGAPRWSAQTIENAILTLRSYFLGGEHSPVTGDVLTRVQLEFVRTCREHELADLPGHETAWYDTCRAMSEDALNAFLAQ